MHIRASFKVDDWDEQPVSGEDGPRRTHAVVRQTVSGDATGNGLAHWLMAYRSDGTADYVGLQEFDGTVDGRAGGFSCTSRGTFDGQTATGTLDILEGSGRGALAGISGNGTFLAPHGESAIVELDAAVGGA